MPLRSRPRPPPAVRRAPRTRPSPPPRRRSPAAMRPTRRSIACSVARSRSKSFFKQAHEDAAHPRGVFFWASEFLMRDALLTLVLSLASATATAADPANFLFADSDDLVSRPALIARPDVAGVQIVYTWKSLERARGEYDFSQI